MREEMVGKCVDGKFRDSGKVENHGRPRVSVSPSVWPLLFCNIMCVYARMYQITTREVEMEKKRIKKVKVGKYVLYGIIFRTQ